MIYRIECEECGKEIKISGRAREAYVYKDEQEPKILCLKCFRMYKKRRTKNE